MPKVAVVSFSMLGHRWDAPFCIKLTDMLKARKISTKDIESVREVVSELQDRKEFVGGTIAKPIVKHVECPNCFSWEIDSTETTVIKTTNGLKHTAFTAKYDCLHCHNNWSLESGSNGQPN